MAVTQYIGARYVPMLADPLEWSSANAYEPLTIVTYQGDSYTSRQMVPVGVPITNETFWVCTGNYNAQIEVYRQEVARIAGQLEAIETTAGTAASDAQAALAKIGSGFDSTDTVRAAVDAINTIIGTLPDGVVDIGSALTSLGEFADSADSRIEALIKYDNEQLDPMLDGFFVPDDTPINVKTYIDEQVEEAKDSASALIKRLTSASDKSFGVSSRHFQDTTYTIAQGFCVFEQAGVTYWAQGSIVDDSNGKVEIYSMATHELIGSVSGYFGHIHSMEYIDGKLYVDGSVSTTALCYTVISVTNPASPAIVTTYTSVPLTYLASRICFVSSTEVLVWSASTNQVYKHDLTSGTDTLVCILQDQGLFDVTVQNLTYDETLGVLVFGCWHGPCVYLYDATTGTRINVLHVPVLCQHVEMNEMQGAHLHGGKLYVNCSEIVYTTFLCSLLEYDYEHGTSYPMFEVKSPSSTKGVYLRVNISDDGDLVHPSQTTFKLASDAIRLLRYQDTDVQLRIHVMGGEYSYPIFLNHADVWLWPEVAHTIIHSNVRVSGGMLYVYDAENFTFDGSNSDSTHAIDATAAKVVIDEVPVLSGTVTQDVHLDYGSVLQVPTNVTFTQIGLSNSVAFAHNDTNFVKSNSFVFGV